MRAVLAVALALLTWSPMVGASQTPPPPAQGAEQRPTFKATVNRVAVAAVVRDRKGKPVTNLKETDFELLDSGQARKIIDFRAELSPVSLALLVDFSGSMDVAVKREAAREVAWHVLSWMKTGRDQVGLFAFDRTLQELAPFGTDDRRDSGKARNGPPLWDDVAVRRDRRDRRSSSPPSRRARRAIVALTDGADNASRLTPEQVSGIASGIDVPVYIVLVISPLDRAGTTTVNEDQIDALQAGPSRRPRALDGRGNLCRGRSLGHQPGRAADRHGASSSVFDCVRARAHARAGIRSNFARATGISSSVRGAGTRPERGARHHQVVFRRRRHAEVFDGQLRCFRSPIGGSGACATKGLREHSGRPGQQQGRHA